MQPCIIPFKNFLEHPKFLSKDKNTLVFTSDFLTDFENELKHFIETIFDQAIPFSQTENTDTCEYCAYNTICNIAIK
jgi:hypothetical protein